MIMRNSRIVTGSRRPAGRYFKKPLKRRTTFYSGWQWGIGESWEEDMVLNPSRRNRSGGVRHQDLGVVIGGDVEL